jgi:hypothetical protein
MSIKDVDMQGGDINANKQDIRGKEWRMVRKWFKSLM